MGDGGHLLTIIKILAPLSIASVGGAMGIYAPLEYQTVRVHEWVTAREFLDMLALTRFLPGPSSILGAVIAFKVAGILGAIVAMLALYVPSSTLCFAMSRIWVQSEGKAWHTAMKRGLTPVAAGLIMSGVLALFQLSGGKLLTGAVMIFAAGMLTWKKSLHPFPLLIAGASVFLAAWGVGLIH
ncbi:MAG: chromate transporter [Hyphomicrobiales bacterium]|nr:chromate transporter [Hyphomicrobiales bacterium]